VALAMTQADAVLEGELAQRALTGDGSAWDALVQRHNHRVLLSLLAAGAPIERAKELAQEAWLRLVEQQRAGRLDRIELPGLAMRQARFLWLEDVRRKSSQPHEPVAADHLIDPGVEAQCLGRQQLERARAALATLPASSQKVFLRLYEQPGLSHAEVAAQVGLSVQRVRQILCEVRKRLRAAVEGD
jgi:RNA polymerase sigma-70 factor (ECF subfamily)